MFDNLIINAGLYIYVLRQKCIIIVSPTGLKKLVDIIEKEQYWHVLNEAN